MHNNLGTVFPPARAGAVNLRRRLMLWALAALMASLTLAGVLARRQRQIQTRWSVFAAGDWKRGADLFFNQKGCGQCHSVNGKGSRVALDLGARSAPHSGLAQLVTAMWNHAPRIWAELESQKVAYPAIDREQMAHLLAFLYVEQCADEPGDARRGEKVFVVRNCSRCHSRPQLSAAGGQTPGLWAEVMWDHASRMAPLVGGLGLPWPRFEGHEMVDLFAYVREVPPRASRDARLPPPDPERGWKVFQEQACIACHSVRGEGGNRGPALGPERMAPVGLVKFAGLMWNHTPEMWRGLESGGSPPTLDGQKMADLAAFLHSLHYSEPAGSPLVGKTLFAGRGCSRCHGPDGEGSRLGPRLRGRGESLNSVALAASLWRHGRTMYEKIRETGVPWPTLAETDVGNLVVFLNTPPQ